MKTSNKRQNQSLTLPQNSFMWASTAFTPGITSSPFTMIGVFARLRRAMCRTALSSVKLIFSPENIASRDASTLRARAWGTNDVCLLQCPLLTSYTFDNNWQLLCHTGNIYTGNMHHKVRSSWFQCKLLLVYLAAQERGRKSGRWGKWCGGIASIKDKIFTTVLNSMNNWRTI